MIHPVAAASGGSTVSRARATAKQRLVKIVSVAALVAGARPCSCWSARLATNLARAIATLNRARLCQREISISPSANRTARSTMRRSSCFLTRRAWPPSKERRRRTSESRLAAEPCRAGIGASGRLAEPWTVRRDTATATNRSQSPEVKSWLHRVNNR